MSTWQKPRSKQAYCVTHQPVHMVLQCSLMPGWWMASGDQRWLMGRRSTSETFSWRCAIQIYFTLLYNGTIMRFLWIGCKNWKRRCFMSEYRTGCGWQQSCQLCKRIIVTQHIKAEYFHCCLSFQRNLRLSCCIFTKHVGLGCVFVKSCGREFLDLLPIPFVRILHISTYVVVHGNVAVNFCQ